MPTHRQQPYRKPRPAPVREGQRTRSVPLSQGRSRALAHPARTRTRLASLRYRQTALSTLDEPVYISEYQRSWPAAFAAERQRLSAALRMPQERIEHIGSTAVPDLASKPVIDLMLGVEVLPGPEYLPSMLESMGYESFGEAGVAGRLYYRKRGESSVNLHVVAYDGEHWIHNLALRDFLRRSAPARERYVQAKRQAIASGATSLLIYSSFKARMVEALLKEALGSGTKPDEADRTRI
jgi:GrpB-like predicted nucleotidyltransferase (UPF0157 family)